MTTRRCASHVPSSTLYLNHATMPRVPTTAQVVPGALVNIVMKADQPTGRTVSGKVAQVLTRGNHPRGIKVRLVDSRVGRVQSMAETVAPDASGANTETASEAPPYGVRPSGRQEQPPATQQVGLDAFIKPARKRGHGKGKNAGRAVADAEIGDPLTQLPRSSTDQHFAGEASTCPVCQDFTGDAAALTYHVQSHFDD